jgi:hypothetical protein
MKAMERRSANRLPSTTDAILAALILVTGLIFVIVLFFLE